MGVGWGWRWEWGGRQEHLGQALGAQQARQRRLTEGGIVDLTEKQADPVPWCADSHGRCPSSKPRSHGAPFTPKNSGLDDVLCDQPRPRTEELWPEANAEGSATDRGFRKVDLEKERRAVKGQAHTLQHVQKGRVAGDVQAQPCSVCGCWMGPWTHPIHLFSQKRRKG